ncbi:MAG: 4Fe-4S dicluster domain-containing protein [Syntrophomonadaceae bacterium]|jgi:heterodisulfide reductase subunit C
MFDKCLKCGLCYDNCYLEQLGIPSFARLARGENASALWTCSNCWTCQDICPAGVPLMAAKWQLQQKSRPPRVYSASLTNILNCGYCLPIDPEDINTFRTDDGLDPLTLASAATIATLLQNE